MLPQPIAAGVGQQAHPRAVICGAFEFGEQAVQGGPFRLRDDVVQRVDILWSLGIGIVSRDETRSIC